MASGDITTQYGTAAALSFSNLNSAANGFTAVSSTVLGAVALAPATDFLIEVTIADIAEAGDKQVIVYAISSVDGTNYSDSGAQQRMVRLGTLDVTGTGPFRSAAFSVAAGFGGVLPPYAKIAIFNDAGVALAASGNSAQYIPVYQHVTP